MYKYVYSYSPQIFGFQWVFDWRVWPLQNNTTNLLLLCVGASGFDRGDSEWNQREEAGQPGEENTLRKQHNVFDFQFHPDHTLLWAIPQRPLLRPKAEQIYFGAVMLYRRPHRILPDGWLANAVNRGSVGN